MAGIRGGAVTIAVAASALAMGWSPSGGFAQEIRSGSYPAPDGSTVVVQHIEVPAPVAEVWDAFTTREGLESWAVPAAWVEFEVGGVWESSYDPGSEPGNPANIRNRYLAYVPYRMIAMQAVDAPPGFPHPEILPDLHSVFQFEEAGEGRTRVTVYGIGYLDTPEHNAVRELFEAANPWTLRQLHRRFVEGPADWTELLGGEGPK